ncbi:tRNA (adenosine(37)-N6)-threonylcarbamoyltransferase complex dimerization subunit type 1 TsaB [Candidatus Endowatersipora endosymbiont of Watersipora subatra]|uniref:tRNA (adenosine(37)-N6)-threonylcarbamoyltransferase complex dimerization subunit type 1 TsaB n=1 Tax=Candidatus Endowatersipora endosymbiont of Watersipora subatra TaxID=3077946 RepID=UPI00312C9BE0
MLLAIDTSGFFCSVALFDRQESTILIEKSEKIGHRHWHTESIIPLLEEVLIKTGYSWNSVNHVVCITGPGSFTGLRVGLATARGLALGLGITSSGVSVFQAFSCYDKGKYPLAVLLDAKRSEIWLQVFDKRRNPLCDPRIVLIKDVLDSVVSVLTPTDNSPIGLAGSGSRIAFREGFKKRDLHSSQSLTVVNELVSPPISSAVEFASLHLSMDLPLRPLYLRAPDASRQNL